MPLERELLYRRQGCRQGALIAAHAAQLAVPVTFGSRRTV
jgi:hypothetical protein